MIGQYVAGAMVKWLKELNRYNGHGDQAFQSSDLTL
jgi:hypothetical protein